MEAPRPDGRPAAGAPLPGTNDDTERPEYPGRVRHAADLAALDAHLVRCRACPRLVAWREHVGAVRRASFAGETYWARPVPGFGDAHAAILVVGLAPAAHGANRTGRMFTGDRSGDFLFAALHRAGLADRPTSVRADDGLTLRGVRVTAPVRCAPPENKPTPAERRRCGPYLGREIDLLGPGVRVAVALGAFGWDALLSTLADQGWAVPRPRPRFAHGAEIRLTPAAGHPCLPDDGTASPSRSLSVLGCFHVSQQNTFTGRLTPSMLDAVLQRAREIADM